jgi:hypothetical protein
MEAVMAGSTLPCEGDIPERFAKSAQLRLWYCDGYQDAMTGKSMQDQEAVRRHQGDHAWDAYCLGYEAGKKNRTSSQAE